YDYDVYIKFADQVGWRRSGNWLSYDELTFLLDGSEKAHLPTVYGLYATWISNYRRQAYLFSRATTCNL
ncbi:MAG: hypothetical protein VKL41_07355, partial [Snowella sp.]|nr:hypothetical protein [Snowella sp.]